MKQIVDNYCSSCKYFNSIKAEDLGRCATCRSRPPDSPPNYGFSVMGSIFDCITEIFRKKDAQ